MLPVQPFRSDRIRIRGRYMDIWDAVLWVLGVIVLIVLVTIALLVIYSMTIGVYKVLTRGRRNE